jgi:flagellar motor switch protein FliM
MEMSIDSVSARPVSELLESVPEPHHHVGVVAETTGARGALLVDAIATSLVIDGVLGGDGRSAPQLDAAHLTPAQNALMSRISKAIVDAISDATTKHGMPRLSLARGDVRLPTEGAPVSLVVRVSIEEVVGHIVLVMSRDALAPNGTGPVKVQGADPRIAGSLGEVELELVAELGRRRMQLSRLAALKPGDLLKLELPLETEARVHVGGRPLFRGRPTSEAGQVAIRIGARTRE